MKITQTILVHSVFFDFFHIVEKFDKVDVEMLDICVKLNFLITCL